MLKKTSFTIASILGITFLPQVQAADQIQDQRWYVAPFASFVLTDEDRKADDGWGGGLSVGKILDKYFNVEVKGFYDGFNGQNGTWSLAGGTADLQYYFFRDKLSPYLVVAAGGLNSCVGNKCGAGLLAEAGLGLTYELTDNFLLRGDVRYRYNNNLSNHVQTGSTEFNEMTVNLGFVIPFGDKPQQVAKAEPRPIPRPEPIVAAPTPAPVVDPCHGRHFKSSKVDANGCPVKIVLNHEHFKFDSAELLPPAREILDSLASDLINDPQKTEVEAKGYASSEGGTVHNQRLSERRARAVVEYLKAKGVTNKLIAKGYGIADPIGDNSTEQGRVENRRVELIWIDN